MGLRDVSSVEKVLEELSSRNYLADRGLATAVFLSLRQNRPLLLEGEAGVGKTELAKSLSDWAHASGSIDWKCAGPRAATSTSALLPPTNF